MNDQKIGVPRQDQEGEAFKRGCRKAVVGLRAVICDAVTSFRGAQKLMTWSLYAVVERWRCQRSSARNDSSVHVALFLSLSLLPRMLLCFSLPRPSCLYLQGKRGG